MTELHGPLLERLCALLSDLTSNPLQMEQAYLDWLGEPAAGHIDVRWAALFNRVGLDADGRPNYPWLHPVTFTERRVSKLFQNYIDNRFSNGENRGQFK